MAERLLKRTAQEVEVAQGRCLVGAKMGEGNENQDTNMRTAFNRLNSNFVGMGYKLSNLPYSLGISIYGARDEMIDVKIPLNNKVDINEYVELMERLETARLELAWLHGYQDTVDLILERKTNG